MTTRTAARSDLRDALGRWTVHRRGIVVALVVGTILNCINQGPALMDGESLGLWRIALTYCVPYCVSVYSAVSALSISARAD